MSDWEHVLDALVRERGPALVRYAALLTGDLGDADDLVQEALVRSFSQGRPLRETLAAESYVRRAILSIFLDGYRRRRRWAGVRHLLGLSDGTVKRYLSDAIGALEGVLGPLPDARTDDVTLVQTGSRR